MNLEECTHYLFPFYPLLCEVDSKVREPPSYQIKLLCSGVIDVINENKRLVEKVEGKTSN